MFTKKDIVSNFYRKINSKQANMLLDSKYAGQRLWKERTCYREMSIIINKNTKTHQLSKSQIGNLRSGITSHLKTKFPDDRYVQTLIAFT